ncbi:MAG TPA: protein kinase [Chloroflexi bacterium]|nr:protein kinase [Chloroflexota bacterium]
MTHTGIYVVELKHWSGRIRVQPNRWLIDGYRFPPDPHIANGFKCRLVKTLYEHRFPTYPNLWVESVVVLTNPDAEIENADSPAVAAERARYNPTFASIDAFIAYLRKREVSLQQRILTTNQIRGIADYYKSQSEPPRSPVYAVPGYETVEYLSQRPDCIELLARPVDGRSRGLTRFRIFRPSVSDSEEERRRAKRKAHGTLDAVAQIGDHPNIQSVWVHMTEEGDIIEGCRWSEAGTLRDLMDDEDTRPDVESAQEICLAIASALAAAHDVGIIHRAVKPEHILMMNGIPKLTDFDLSYQLERPIGDLTVLPDPTRLKDDGYTAPELLEGRDIDESTDLFSLGVLAYELFVGEKPHATARQLAAQGGALSDRQIRRLRDVGLSDEVIAVIQDAIVADRSRRLCNARAFVEAFAPDDMATDGPDAPPPNARLEPGDTYDVYEILEFLGQGAEAQIYRAKTMDEDQVALKVFNREVPRERALRERTLMRCISSDHVVGSDGRYGHWHGERYFLVMDCVEGETLRQLIDRGDLPDGETFRRVALDLLDALRAFHEHRDEEGRPSPLIHGDVKPENVVITHGGSAILIDLSVAGPPRTEDFAGTVGYVPPDRILGTEMQFAPDGDTFALGVTLWEWLYGAKPQPAPTVGGPPPRPAHPRSCIATSWTEWLLQALATDGSQRYATASKMLEALPQDADVPIPDVHAEAAVITTDPLPPTIPFYVAPPRPPRTPNPRVTPLSTI